MLQHIAPLALRLVMGSGFIAHGTAKLSRGTQGFEKLLIQTGVPLAHINAQVVPWLELIGGIALLTGIFVRIISLPLMITMIVAMLTIHIHYGFSSVNTIGLKTYGPEFGPPGYEINLLYIAGLLAIMIIGAGRFSIDHLMQATKNKQLNKRPMVALTTLMISALTILYSINALANQTAISILSQKTDTSILVAGVPLEPQDISPLLIGEKLPAASLKDDNNTTINLDKIVKRPTVLVFYRGGWCPYCAKQLFHLQQIETDLGKAGYQLLAVSTDSPENLRKTREKEKLSFTLLSDADLSLSKAVGIAYKAPPVYDNFLTEASGGKNTAKLLPVPSVFILDKTGAIQFEYINPDFKQRMSPQLLKEITAAIARQQDHKLP